MNSNSSQASAKDSIIKKVTTIAMLCAIAYAVTFITHTIPFLNFIPSVSFLKYDPTDIIIAIGSFMMGPLAGVIMSVIVSFIEMITISTTGPIGFIMNVISSCAFACTSAVIYKKKRDMTGAVIGLISGVVAMTAVMLLWNYFLTPIYQKVPREVIVKLLIPGFLPFNLIKASINAAFVLLLYRPIVTALRNAALLPPSISGKTTKNSRVTVGISIVAVLILASCVLLILVLSDII
jgi:Predicted membrane protein